MPIAFIHPGALGDLILALPAMQTLAASGAVELYAAGGRAKFLAGRSALAIGHDLEDPGMTCLFGPDFSPADVPARIAARFRRFGRVVSGIAAGPFAENVAKLLSPGARVERLDLRPGAIESAGVHASIFIHRQLFGGDGSACPIPRIGAAPSDREEASKLLRAVGIEPRRKRRGRMRILVAHPGSGGPAKCWHVEGFAAVANILAAAGWATLFVLGPAERDRGRDRELLAATADLRTTWPDAVSLLAEPTLAQLAGVIASADAYLGNDAGPTHLAAALGAPTVALFGPTEPAIWGPRGSCVRIVRGNPSQKVQAGPCPGFGGIDPSAVADAIGAVASMGR